MAKRSLMKRKDTMSLDGLWQLDGQDIIVPYPPQAKKSLFKGNIQEEMTYTKDFKRPDWSEGRIFLCFGAVDQIADVYLNDVFLIHHEDGYLPFEAEVTDLLKEDNVVKAICKDALDKTYSYGKQTKEPKGMWYTPVSFIWQSVYLEHRGEHYIQDLKISTDMQKVTLEVKGNFDELTLVIDQDDVHFKRSYTTKTMTLDLKVLGLPRHLWSPGSPYLYHFSLTSEDDELESYFALREFKIKKVIGYERFFLNDEVIFLCGLLDQGYFGEDIYTVTDHKVYERDILKAKALGYNLLRKHVKIEALAFYEACDRLGVLVMQDLVNNGPYDWLKDTALPTLCFKHRNDHVNKLTKRHEVFLKHAESVQDLLYSHPPAIAYTIFNEGWGQFNADEIYEHLKNRDPNHIYDATSGWFNMTKNDLESEHVYFRNKVLHAKDKALLLSECGGYVYSPDIELWLWRFEG